MQDNNYQDSGYIQVTGGNIFWNRIGNDNQTPILTIHGGPGGVHDLFVKPFGNIAHNRQIYFYDQLGSGNSDRPDDLSLWVMERFIEEINILRDTLKLDELIFWGSSWGTMLITDYMLTKPSGIKAVILSSPCLSAKIWKNDADRLRLKLPKEIQEILLKHENNNTTNSSEYKKAEWEYMKRFFCILDPIPNEIMALSSKHNKELYQYMWGPSEFYPTGTLKNYDRTKDLHKIKQPTLFLCGEYDEATPEATKYYASLTPNSEYNIIKNAAHISFYERTEEYMKILQEFIERAP